MWHFTGKDHLASARGGHSWLTQHAWEMWIHWPLAAVLGLLLCVLVAQVPKEQRFPVFVAGLGPPLLLLALQAGNVLLVMSAVAEIRGQAG
ncbi:MAG: hypothetical protein ACI9VR_004855 [Cognaticolwellia sp.]|jgi:hypothetical protein